MLLIVVCGQVVVWVFFEFGKVYELGQLLMVLQSQVRGRIDWLFPVLAVVVEIVFQKK